MIHSSEKRIGNFTSSEIVALLSEPTAAAKKEGKIFGKPALTYIEECNWERKLGRSIGDKVNARSLTWGKLLERCVPHLLPKEYIISCEETIVHPTIPFWSGSKDGVNKSSNGRAVVDLKCPITLKSFCQLVDPLYEGLSGIEAMNKIRETHKDGEKFYWQILSNSILEEAALGEEINYGELIVYMPYFSELAAIKHMADGQQDCYWITMGLDDELPYLIDGGYYNNLNIIRFAIPEEDKKLLTNRVLEAGKMLINNQQVMPQVEINSIPLIKINQQ